MLNQLHQRTRAPCKLVFERQFRRFFNKAAQEGGDAHNFAIARHTLDCVWFDVKAEQKDVPYKLHLMSGRWWYPHASRWWHYPCAPRSGEHDQSGRSNNQLSAPMLMPLNQRSISKKVAKRNDRAWGVLHSANINCSNHRPTQIISLPNIADRTHHHWLLS